MTTQFCRQCADFADALTDALAGLQEANDDMVAEGYSPCYAEYIERAERALGRTVRHG